MFSTFRLTERTDKGKGCKINFDQICGSHDWLNMLADQSLRQPTIEYVDSGYSFERCPLHSMTNCTTCAVQRLLHLANCCFSDVSNQKVGYSTATQYECSVTRSTNSSAAMTTWQRATAVHVQTAWPCLPGRLNVAPDVNNLTTSVCQHRTHNTFIGHAWAVMQTQPHVM